MNKKSGTFHIMGCITPRSLIKSGLSSTAPQNFSHTHLTSICCKAQILPTTWWEFFADSDDDGLKSIASIPDAIALIEDNKELCRRGGFGLHKFTSNFKEVIKAIPVEDRAEGIQKIDMDRDALPIERALGVQRCIEKDSFQFRTTLKDRPCTRRGILSTISSIYDSLGFAAPLLLNGKKILHELCRGQVDWDDEVPSKQGG